MCGSEVLICGGSRRGASRYGVSDQAHISVLMNNLSFPAKAPVVGTPISMTSYQEVMDRLANRPSDRATVISVCTVHSVMSARRDETLATALRDSDIATPDGMPLVWALRWTARGDQQRVYGPELMRKTLIEQGGFGLGHYLYGSSNETLSALSERVEQVAPGAQIVGTCSPPFRALTADEEDADLERIRASGADVVWVGLGMPKQELWMARVKDRLPGVALVGVGAAFDFIAGTKKQAPPWMARSGLEWVYRLFQEPRRLWRRYIWNNPAYMALLLSDVIRGRVRG